MNAGLQRDAWWVGIAVALALACRAYVGILTSDDAYITFRYARHLAADAQPVFNLGERVLGTSTPLFMLVLAAAARAHVPLQAAAFAISLAADAVSLVVVSRLLETVGERLASRMAVFMLAVVPVFLTSVASGMEAPLYTALILSAMRALPSGEHAGRSAFAPGVLLGLTAICRPEGIMAGAAALVALAIDRRWTTAIRVAIGAGLTAAPWILFAAIYYGSPVPQSVVAKAAGQAHMADGIRTFGALVGSARYLPITALAVIGGARLWQRGVAWRALIVWWVIYAGAFTVTGAFARAEWYFTPLLPVYFASAAVGLCRLFEVSQLRRWRVAAPALCAAAFVAISLVHLPQHRRTLEHARAIREQTYLRIARQIAASRQPCDVAASEIGAIGEGFEGRIIDLAGLVTPTAVGSSHAREMQRERAHWLVEQNIFMSDDLRRDAWFTASFRKVETVDLDPGRTTDVYERADGSCGSHGLPRS